MIVRSPLQLAHGATFSDLIFRPHTDGDPGHTHALHVFPNGRLISITRGGQNFGTPRAPYEMQDWDGQIHAPLTSGEVTEIMAITGARVIAPKPAENADLS